MVLWGHKPSFNQASGSVSQPVPTKHKQGLTDGQLTTHPWGGLSPAGPKTEGVGAEPGNNQSAPMSYVLQHKQLE